MHRLIGAALEAAVPDLAAQPRPAPTWASLGTVEGLGDLLRGRLIDVEVRPVVRDWHFVDPAAYFRGMPSWSGPVRPLFDMLPEDRIDAAAAAFADDVDAQGGRPGGPGIPMAALMATGVVS